MRTANGLLEKPGKLAVARLCGFHTDACARLMRARVGEAHVRYFR
jgi:hypothetical protein